MQQAEFSGGDVRGLAADHERHGVTMQFKVWSGDACGQGLLKTPQHRPDAGCKFANAERLSDVIVGAKVQAANAVFLTCARGQENDRDAGKITALANLAADFKAAVSGNHDVEQKEDGRLLARLGQNFVTRSTKAHVESGRLQVVADQVANVQIVFKNNNVLFQWVQSIRIMILTAYMGATENPLAIVSSSLGCYHRTVNRFKTFPAKMALGLALAASAALYATSPTAVVLPPVPSTVDSITPGELRMHLQFLASPELGGRYTLSPSFAIAARYLASHLEAYGFKGAGEHGDFLQTFQVVSSKPDTAKSVLEISFDGKPKSYRFGDFYIPAEAGNGDAQGKIVFVATGISSPSQHQDDYAGLDVKGKIVLIVPGAPSGIDMSRLDRNEYGQGAARAHGAVGILQLPPQRLLEMMKGKGFQERAASRENIRLARNGDGNLPQVALGPAVAEDLLGACGLDVKTVYQAANHKQKLQAKSVDLTTKMTVATQQTKSTTQNVAGILEGTDPVLKNEYVVFSAHYDHLKTSPGGEIYPGADDDGSGTTSVLAIAHAMSLERPKRSVLVMFHAGEELGLLGSEYNTEYAPVVPLKQMVADLNIDMIGRSKQPGDNAMEDDHLTDANTVYLVGSNRISQELHQLSEETNSQFQKMKLDYYYNDPNNPERIYFRSDHWNYAKHGIPIIFYFDGTSVDYHRPTDTIEKIDFTKMTKVARLVFETGWRIANLDHRLANSHQ